MNFDSDNWERAKELFDAALDLRPSERPAFLAQNCHDETLRRQIEELLLNYQQAGNFLDDPVVCGWSDAHTAEEPCPSKSDPAELATVTSLEIEDPMVGRLLGAYKLIRRIGQGGMAAVFLAVRADDTYRKEVAIKLVQPGSDRHELLNRFRNERQTLAGLDHPNIVKLLDGGSTPEGLPFLVMDYVEGTPIDDYCDRHNLRIDGRLRLFSKVCEAVQYAHQKSIVHRDLKPSNILVTGQGTPKLLDFGIAKVLNPIPSAQGLVLTQTGMRCMTPAYASPEQMRGKSITTATDIYSLGVVLYELLTGHRPYKLTQHTPAEVERAICEQDPETPSTAVSRVETETSTTGIPITKTPEVVSQTREGEPDKLRRRLRGDLDNIVLKALQKEPARRYASVEEFSQDIERHLQQLPVRARRSTIAYRASKFAQRHKIEVASVITIALVVAAAVLLAANIFGIRDRVLRLASGTPPHTPAAARLPRSTGRTGEVGISSVISCESLMDLKLTDTTITSTQLVTSGSFTPAGADPIADLPDFCRVEGVSRPSDDSEIRFEVWMPPSGWNGKFRGVGNFGFGGSINYYDMAPAVRYGYAVASTDTGHVGQPADSLWSLGHPEKQIDYGYRAIHEMTEKAKAAVRAFYGEAPRASFFQGCSNGGRQALMEAQRFPEDYQGILAGAPAYSATHVLTAALYNMPSSPAGYIPATKIPAISAAVLAACDAQDGIKDGILNDPRQCHFDPSTLHCHGPESASCLTSPQVAQLKKLYSGLHNSKGELLYPGYLPGGEEGGEGWGRWLSGGRPGQAVISIFAINYFRDMVFEDPAWNYRTDSAQEVLDIADAKNARIYNATDPDLRRFQAHGGKLILYQGWSDPGFPPVATINYYDDVVGNMGLQNAQSFARLYMAPGMQHCTAGPGPNFFGQVDLSFLAENPQQVSASLDPDHNVFAALEKWVERDIAPGAIIATKFVNDNDPSQGIKMTRPLCPYPQIAQYKGSGDINDAANFVCVEQKDQHSRTLVQK
jgi:feruloyl esterase